MTRNKHLYIHVPFCSSICYYCDFTHRIYKEDVVSLWLKTIKKEIKDANLSDMETIYIGGGTPSCLKISELNELLSLIKPYSDNVLEYTIEVNPESLDLDKILLFKKYGINRISMGVQSSDDNILKSLNRKHSFNDVKEKIKLLKENGFHNISIDLMYSLPNQNIELLDKTLDDFLALDIPHISIYSLTINENTVFYKQNVKPLDNDIEADMYELIIDKLEKNNYIQYEVSNFSKEGYESKHNTAYWNYDDFIGISMGAASKINHQRYFITSNFNKYFKYEDIKEEIEDLNKDDEIFENIMMSLRMKKGINIKQFNSKYDINLLDKYQKALNNPNIEIIDGYLRVKNLAILNNTLLDFMGD